MSNVPEGAQLSDDGQWWWDGSAWQAVEDGQEQPAQQAVEGGQEQPAQQAAESGQEQAAQPPEVAFDAETGQEADLPDVESVV